MISSPWGGAWIPSTMLMPNTENDPLLTLQIILKGGWLWPPFSTPYTRGLFYASFIPLQSLESYGTIQDIIIILLTTRRRYNCLPLFGLPCRFIVCLSRKQMTSGFDVHPNPTHGTSSSASLTAL